MGSTFTAATVLTATTPTRPDRIVSTSVQLAAVDYLARLRSEARFILELWAVKPDTIDSVVLSLSELYTNVATHVPGPCTVIIRLTPERLRLTVRDSSLVIPDIPEDPTASLLSEHGRGLAIVAAYADKFFFQRADSRYGSGKSANADWEMAA